MTTPAAPDRPPSSREAGAQVGGLFERHGRMVYGICRAMLRDAHDAEDATQQVFLSAHTALLGRASVRDPGGWLATIARNECRARIAAGMRRPLAVADQDLDALPASRDEQLRRSQLDEIRTALAALPERQREAVVLRYFCGLRYGEVATALGLSRPATEALLFRARRALRAGLRPVAGAVLVVPAIVREQLALALPGFEERTASVAVGVGLAGGMFAKLTAGSAGVKVATTAAAVSAVGAVGTVGPDRLAGSRDGWAVVPIERRVESAGVSTLADDDSGTGTSRHSSEGDSAGPREDRDDRAHVHGEAALDGRRAQDGDRTNSGSGRDGNDNEGTNTTLASTNERDGDSASSGSGIGGAADDRETADPADSSGHGSSASADRSGSSGSGSGGSSRSDNSTSGSSGASDEETGSEPDDD